MSAPRPPGFDTLALHAGTSRAPDAARACDLSSAVFEERMASLEYGVAALATASGQAALHLAIGTIVSSGEHIVASNELGADAHHLLAHTLRRFGIETTFVDPRGLDGWRAAIRPTTRLLFGESISRQGLGVLDIPALSSLAHQHDLPLLVDASCVSPWLQRPLTLGADLVLHSASDFLCGPATTTGGVLIDGGSFDWQAAHARSGRFATLCEPDAGFEGEVFAEESSVAAFALRARREGLRDFGAALSSQCAATILPGLDTLSLRMQRHVANTRRIAQYLLGQAGVTQVSYPELDSHPDHALAQQLLARGSGAEIYIELQGDGAMPRRLLANLRLIAPLANGVRGRTLVSAAPAHGATLGSSPRLRLSIGLEDPDDLIDDLKRAFKIAAKGA